MSKQLEPKNLITSREKRQQRYQSYRKKQKSEDRAVNAKDTLKRFIMLAKPYAGLLILVATASIIATILNVYGPKMLGEVINALKIQVENRKIGMNIEYTEIHMACLKLFIVYFSGAIMTFIQQYTLAGISQKLVCSLRDRLNAKLSLLPLKYYDSTTKGEILSKVMNDCDNISGTLQNNITTVVTSVVQVIGVFVLMLTTNAMMTLLAVVLVPFSVICSYGISRISRKYFKQHWDRLGEINGHIEEMYSGHTIVRLFNKEEESVEEFNDINDELYLVTRKANYISGIVGPIMKLLSNISYLSLCVYGGILVLRSTLMIGDVISFFAYTGMFSSPIQSVGNIINHIQSALASAERIFGLLDEPEEKPDDPKCEIKSTNGNVEFRDVSFRYIEDKPLIENMNIKVEHGQLVAIVGPTGAGKTTFVNLLMRFYDVNSGQILIDGVNIQDITRNNLRTLFGMVLQDTWLFKGTIRDNIAYGRREATSEEIIEAAKAAKVHHFIETLSEGYDTILDEDGTNISQGQRQLLTIARAILANPAILILDEATSSVDTRTELQIQEAMKTLMENRTNFVIAHRLSTIKMADIILVMRQGRIVEQGTHSGLLEAEGFYAQLYKSQYTGGIPPEDVD